MSNLNITDTSNQMLGGKNGNNSDSSYIPGKSTNVEKIVDKIFNQVSECHFAKDQKAVCSPVNIVNKMEVFIKEKGEDITKKTE